LRALYLNPCALKKEHSFNSAYTQLKDFQARAGSITTKRKELKLKESEKPHLFQYLSDLQLQRQLSYRQGRRGNAYNDYGAYQDDDEKSHVTVSLPNGVEETTETNESAVIDTLQRLIEMLSDQLNYLQQNTGTLNSQDFNQDVLRLVWEKYTDTPYYPVKGAWGRVINIIAYYFESHPNAE